MISVRSQWNLLVQPSSWEPRYLHTSIAALVWNFQIPLRLWRLGARAPHARPKMRTPQFMAGFYSRGVRSECAPPGFQGRARGVRVGAYAVGRSAWGVWKFSRRSKYYLSTAKWANATLFANRKLVGKLSWNWLYRDKRRRMVVGFSLTHYPPPLKQEKTFICSHHFCFNIAIHGGSKSYILLVHRTLRNSLTHPTPPKNHREPHKKCDPVLKKFTHRPPPSVEWRIFYGA